MPRILTILMGLLLAPPLHAEWFSDAQGKMGTRVEIQLWAEKESDARRLLALGMAEFDRIEAEMSTYREETPISRVNREADRHPVEVSQELYDIVATSLDLSRRSEGAFDITFDSVGQLYDFRRRQRPDEQAIAASLPSIDYRHVKLDPEGRTIRFSSPGTRINLGGIGKGYAVERVVAVLREAGVRHALANAGGDTRLLGDRRGKPWMLGIRDPDVADRWVTRLALQDEAVSTAGDYERFFDEDGTRYHHIIDPGTGHSASTLRSVTVVGPDGTMTDGLDTAVFVLGAEKGMALVEATAGYEAIIIDTQHNVRFSKGFAAR